jgi:hypothetical protein
MSDMPDTSNELENLVISVFTTMTERVEGAEQPPNEADMRQRFFELLPLILGNLYGKTPVAASLFDRNIFLRVSNGMDDTDSGKLALRTEDWLRLEGILRQQDGQKAYTLTRPTLSILSSITAFGTLGESLEKVLKHYAEALPTPETRQATRLIGAYILSVFGNS